MLTGPTDRDEHLDAEDWAMWQARQSMWRNTLRGWCQLAECYAANITEKVLDTPAHLLQEKGVAQISQFPNSDPEAFIAYKTFWILLKNWREHRREAEEAVYAAAFQGATTNLRPVILGDEAVPNALART